MGKLVGLESKLEKVENVKLKQENQKLIYQN